MAALIPKLFAAPERILQLLLVLVSYFPNCPLWNGHGTNTETKKKGGGIFQITLEPMAPVSVSLTKDVCV